jgi:hypothetical protein
VKLHDSMELSLVVYKSFAMTRGKRWLLCKSMKAGRLSHAAVRVIRQMNRIECAREQSEPVGDACGYGGEKLGLDGEKALRRNTPIHSLPRPLGAVLPRFLAPSNQHAVVDDDDKVWPILQDTSDFVSQNCGGFVDGRAC